jgi:hypothetical protein
MLLSYNEVKFREFLFLRFHTPCPLSIQPPCFRGHIINDGRFKSLYILTQKAHYKTGNVRKLEAAIKLYGGLLGVYPEAVQKLSSMLLHPFPNIRNQVADTLWVDKGVGKGVNWVKAKKDDLKILLEELERK